MATPRSPYVCIADALLDEPWDPWIKLAMVLLSCHIHNRWRADRRLTLESACREHPVGLTDLMKITQTLRRDRARHRLNVVAKTVSISIRLDGDVAYLSWPKWAEYNRLHSRSAVFHESKVDPVKGPSASSSLNLFSEEERPPSKTQEDEPAPPAPARGVPRLVNFLSREDGTPEAKAAFATKNEQLIVAEARSECPHDAKARSAKLEAITIRYWRQELLNPGGGPRAPNWRAGSDLEAHLDAYTNKQGKA